MKYSRGSEWGRWDLHVHTPDSLINKYGAGGGDPWDNFVADLEALPSEFCAIGVNDYIFLDGYKALCGKRDSGAVPNLDLLLPVVELRLSHFGGSGSEFSRINLHVIFSEELDPSTIEAQFINGLRCDVSLLPGNLRDGQWTGLPTRESLASLGQAIRDSSEVKPTEPSDLLLGFNNFNVSFDNVLGLLTNPVFDNKYMLAVGKVEWEDQRWNEQSIAFKKTLINRPLAVFAAADTPANFRRARQKLVKAGVNDRLLDCSDAHFRASASQANRIGNCLTWVNATPTFEGLLHALHEYDSRIHVDDALPPKLISVRSHPSDYFTSVKVSPREKADAVPRIDVEVELNPGVIAIVGNKGKGKSALADVVGLLAGSDRAEHFSFLNEERFCSPQGNPAGQHRGTLEWENQHTATCALDSAIESGTVPRVRYLPQSYLESVCENGPGGDELFARELGEVIFSHVDDPDRLETSNLDELIDLRSAPTRRRLEMLRSEQAEIIRSLLAVRSQLSGTARSQLVALEEERSQELRAHDDAKPEEVPEPDEQDEETVEAQQRLAALREDLGRYDERVEQMRGEATNVAVRLERVGSLRKELANLEHAIERARMTISPLAGELGLAVDDLVKVDIDLAPIESVSDGLNARQEVLRSGLSETEEGSAARLCVEARKEIEDIESELQTPARLRQAYLSRLAEWESERRAIIGSKTLADSLENIRHRLEQFEELPAEEERLWGNLLDHTGLIHEQLAELASIYAELHEPVQAFIDSQPLAKERFQLSFQVELVEHGLSERFFALVGRQVTGSYSGGTDGNDRLSRHLRSTDFNDRGEVVDLVRKVEDDLTHDNRKGREREAVSVGSQLRKGASVQQVYELVFGLTYVEPDFWLRSEGMPISQLSPGQRGTLLLLFYLVVDQSTTPIVLDQPEENLDNETVHDLLVPAIADARHRRQVIVVTHNPNLAVVGDADQIVVAEASGGVFEYSTGAIESVPINDKIIAILEGTWPAFTNRTAKYRPSRFRGTRADPQADLSA